MVRLVKVVLLWQGCSASVCSIREMQATLRVYNEVWRSVLSDYGLNWRRAKVDLARERLDARIPRYLRGYRWGNLK